MGLESMISSIVPFTLCPTYLKLFLQVIWAISNMADKLLHLLNSLCLVFRILILPTCLCVLTLSSSLIESKNAKLQK